MIICAHLYLLHVNVARSLPLEPRPQCLLPTLYPAALVGKAQPNQAMVDLQSCLGSADLATQIT